MNTFKLGLTPDTKDERDYVYNFWWKPKEKLPTSARIKMPKIRDQKNIGSCASFAITTILSHFYNLKFEFSPLFVYYNARLNEFGEKGILEDSGNTLRGVLKSINKTGFCTEYSWLYKPELFKDKPSKNAYMAGIERRNEDKIYYTRALDTDAIKQGIVDGYVPYLGFTIYENFYSKETMECGVASYPKGKALGGHAVVISGYDDDLFGGCFIIHNSWSEGAGHNGYFYFPYKVFEKLVNDCWLVKVIPDII